MLETVSAAWVRASMSASGCRTTLWKAPHPEPYGKQEALESAKVEAAPEVREAKPLVKFFLLTLMGFFDKVIDYGTRHRPLRPWFTVDRQRGVWCFDRGPSAIPFLHRGL